MFDFWDEPKRSRPTFTAKEKEALYKGQNGKCNGCGTKFPIRNMTVDHIRAFSKGGGERLTNLQLLCGACNSLKGSGTMGELRKKLRQQAKPKTAGRPTRKKKQTRKRDPFDFW